MDLDVENIGNPDYWRQRAESTRSSADKINDPDSKATILRLADTYDRVAERTQELLSSNLGGEPA